MEAYLKSLPMGCQDVATRVEVTADGVLLHFQNQYYRQFNATFKVVGDAVERLR
jgi:hypothetical protein